MARQCRIRGRVAAIAVFLLVPAFSQTTPPSSSGSSTGSGPKTPVPTTPTITGNTTNNTQQTTMQPTLRVSGRVIMDDGSPLSFPAVIERVCNGSPHAEGYTDTKGYFSLVLGQNMEVIADASEVPTGNGRVGMAPGIATASTVAGSGAGSGRSMGGLTPYSNCELRASLGGYLSQTINLTGRTSMDNPDVGTISLRRMGATDTSTTVTATTLKAPKRHAARSTRASNLPRRISRKRLLRASRKP